MHQIRREASAHGRDRLDELHASRIGPCLLYFIPGARKVDFVLAHNSDAGCARDYEACLAIGFQKPAKRVNPPRSQRRLVAAVLPTRTGFGQPGR